jgi:uncharacterized membrane protein YbhN (UPF0104 family)
MDDPAMNATASGSAEPAPKERRPIRTILGITLTAVLLLFVIHSIWTQWGEVRAYDWTLHAGWLALSAVLMWVDLIGLILLYRWLLIDIAQRPLSFPKVYRASMLANLGKYIPGKIWSVMGLVYLLKREGYPAPATLSSALLHQAYMIVAGAGFFWVILGAEFLINVPVIAVIIGLGGCLLILYPPVFSFLLNRGLRVLGREPVQIPRSFVRAVIRLFLYVVAWIAYGASSYCLLRGVGIDVTAFWEITAIFGAAYLVGFLALFAPGGLGVRESIITLLLASYLPGGLPAAIAVAARFWTTILELLGLLPLLGQIRRPDAMDDRP